MATVDLQFHLDGTYDLLNESEGIFYSKTDNPGEMTRYVNEARRRVAFDAKLFRNIQPFTITEDQTIYSIPSVAGFIQSFSLFRIYVTSGARTYPLSQENYTDLMDKWLRTTQKTDPVAWAKINQSTFRIGPIPARDYVAELDLVSLVDDLVQPDDADVIIQPFADCVKFHAAHIAFLKDKAYVEADQMIQEYEYWMSKNLGDAVEWIAARRFYQTYGGGAGGGVV